jgi:hypothetical protein
VAKKDSRCPLIRLSTMSELLECLESVKGPSLMCLSISVHRHKIHEGDEGATRKSELQKGLSLITCCQGSALLVGQTLDGELTSFTISTGYAAPNLLRGLYPCFFSWRIPWQPFVYRAQTLDVSGTWRRRVTRRLSSSYGGTFGGRAAGLIQICRVTFGAPKTTRMPFLNTVAIRD